MARHIGSTKKARDAIRDQRRQSLLIALWSASGLLLLILAALYLARIAAQRPAPAEISAYQAQSAHDTQPGSPAASRMPSRQTLPANALAAVIPTISLNHEPVPFAPVNTDDYPAPMPGFPDSGTGLGSGFGEGIGTGPGLPGALSTRCSPALRKRRLLETGGTEACEEAVVKSLRWLKTRQNADGSWGTPPHQASMTGLCLLTYLAHCETPYSGEFGAAVLDGMTWLVNLGMKSPVLSTLPGDKYLCYEHAIATYAVCETYSFCRLMNIPALEELETVARQAVAKILDSQHPGGGWCYYYGSDAPDTSITGWNVQALKAARHAGLGIDDRRMAAALARAGEFVRGNSMPDGRFSYLVRGEEPRGSLVGVGVLSLQMAGMGRDPAARRGLDWMAAQIKRLDWHNKNDNSNLYMHYYCAQAAMNAGGESWSAYNDAFRDVLLEAQAGDGSFPPTGTAFPSHYNMYAIADPEDPHYINGCIYRQTLATLMLEVYYRFLPGTGQ